MEIENLPRIGFVLISHDHYDHLDEYSVLKLFHLFPNIYWIIPQGLKGWFEKRKIKKDNIIELNWWERVSLAGLDIHAVPTQHFSGRGFFDFNKTRCNGYVIDFKIDNKKCYFAGDTGYNASDFKSIGDRFNKIDLSLIPIGAYEPNMLMRQVHINPKEAVLIHQDVKSIFSLGMHWKTFTLSEEPMHNPPYELHLALKQHNIDPKNFLAIDPGVYVNW
jgi:N-acyl-phosphatidylethanolamine-hydrolysing phospholipase D